MIAISGLPDSRKTAAVNQFLQFHVKHNLDTKKAAKPSFQVASITCHELIGIGPTDTGEIAFREAAEESSIAFGILSAFKQKILSDRKVPILTELMPEDSNNSIDAHLQAIYKSLCSKISVLKDSKLTNDGREYARELQSTLPESLGLVNIWDLASHNSVHDLLSALQGHLYNSHMWLFLDLKRDINQLDEHFDIPKNTNDGQIFMKQRPRLHYLLRACWSAKGRHAEDERRGVCTMFATHELDVPGEAWKKIQDVADKVQSAAGHIGVSGLLEEKIQCINLKSNSRHFYDKIQSIFLDEKPSTDVPLAWIFLRSSFYHIGKVFITKKGLRDKAAECLIKDEFVDKFCEFFTSFGSIIDLSLIQKKVAENEEERLIIIDPLKFFEKLDAFFDKANTLHPAIAYGILIEKVCEESFGDEWRSYMHALECLNLATRTTGGFIEFNPEHNISNDDATRNYFYYIPLCCTGPLETKPDPHSVHLITNINTPHFFKPVLFAKELLTSDCKLVPCKSRNQTIIKDMKFNATITISSHAPVIKIHVENPCDDVCSRIIKATYNIAKRSTIPVKFKFVRLCSMSSIPDVESLPSANYHLLPGDICQQCQDDENGNLWRLWKTALSEVSILNLKEI